MRSSEGARVGKLLVAVAFEVGPAGVAIIFLPISLSEPLPDPKELGDSQDKASEEVHGGFVEAVLFISMDHGEVPDAQEVSFNLFKATPYAEKQRLVGSEPEYH